jgi:hypothetical protein
LPSTLKYIKGSAFEGCTNLEEINIPESVTFIGDSAFADCVSLKEITLPENLFMMDKNAFKGCTGIKSITIPKNVSISDSAFAGWTAEQTVNFVGDPYSVFVLDGTALNNSNANFVFNYKETAGE